jgi:beta-xylosidase
MEGEADWTWLPEVLDASILSDEATAPGQPNFTGAFVGVACQDGSGAARPADFAWFDYADERTAHAVRRAIHLDTEARIGTNRNRG